MELRSVRNGLYEVFGNTVEVCDGVASDLDSGDEIPMVLVEEMGVWIREEL